MYTYASSLDVLHARFPTGIRTVALRIDGLDAQQDDTLKNIFEQTGARVSIDPRDVKDAFAWAKDTDRLYRIATTVIKKFKEHKTGVVSYILYATAVKVIAALAYRIAHSKGVEDKDTQMLRYLLVYMNRVLNEFDPEHVASQGLDERIKSHKDGAFYTTVKKYAGALIKFFKVLWAKLKSFVTGKAKLDPNVANPAKLVPAAITKLASLDGIYKNMGKGIVSTKPDPELPPARTDFRATQHAILDADREDAE